MASRAAAAPVSRGGYAASHQANARATAASSASAAHRPAGPAVASRWPGSGLAAGVRCLVRPSGNSTAFCSALSGSSSSAGAQAVMAATAVSAARTAKRPACALPRVTAIVAASTGRAGHAVALRAQARPVATAEARGARVGWAGRAGRVGVKTARDRHSSAITGTSVPPVVTCSAMTGEASAKTVLRSAVRPGASRSAAASRNARYRAAAPVRVSQNRGSPAQPGRTPPPPAPTACGSPKAAMSGS
jgi:hypothetical protein